MAKCCFFSQLAIAQIMFVKLSSDIYEENS